MGVWIPGWEGTILRRKSGGPMWSIATLCCKLCKMGWTDWDAVWDLDLGRPKEACIRCGCTTATTVHVRWQCDLLSNYFDPTHCYYYYSLLLSLSWLLLQACVLSRQTNRTLIASCQVFPRRLCMCCFLFHVNFNINCSASQKDRTVNDFLIKLVITLLTQSSVFMQITTHSQVIHYQPPFHPDGPEPD